MKDFRFIAKYHYLHGGFDPLAIFAPAPHGGYSPQTPI
jgi:hypothetical protein